MSSRSWLCALGEEEQFETVQASLYSPDVNNIMKDALATDTSTHGACNWTVGASLF